MLEKQKEKQDPRVKRTRQRLQQAFIELLGEKTLSSITISDVTARADVNRATFYAHFEDKEDLLTYMVKEDFQEAVHQGFDDYNAQFSTENLHALTIVVCEFLRRFKSRCQPVGDDYRPFFTAQIQHHTNNVILTWLQPLELAKPARERIAATLSWAILGTAFQWIESHSRQSATEVADELVDLFTRGIEHVLLTEVK